MIYKFLIHNNINYFIKVLKYYKLEYIIKLYYISYFVIILNNKVVLFSLIVYFYFIDEIIALFYN